MARRTRNTESNNNEVQEDTVSTVTEAPEAPAEVEAPANENTEQAAEAPAEKPAEKEVDLTAFKAAVDNAVANKDVSTGELAVAFVEPVQTAYRELDGTKAKNKAKAELNERMRVAMNSMDIVTARTYLVLTDALAQATGGHKTEKAPADPTEAFVQKVVGLRLALQLASDVVPEGVEDGWQDKAKALFDSSIEPARQLVAWNASEAEDKGEEPETSAVVKAAVKLSQGKAARVGKSGGSGGGTFTGERRDIAKHIQNAFADKEPGTFMLIAEIKNTRSDEYGDNPPSAGAISARLFPASGKCSVEGVKPETNEKGRKGAVKL